MALLNRYWVQFRIHRAESWAASAAMILVALFPMIGNALSIQDLINRRVSQIIVLCLGIGLYFVARGPAAIVVSWQKAISQRLVWKRSLVAFGVLTLPLVFSAFSADVHIDLGNATVVLYSLTLALLIIVAITVKRSHCRASDVTSLADFNVSPTGAYVLGGVGLSLSLISWLTGPPAGESYFSFGGSTITMSLCASAGLFMALFSFPYRWAIPIGWPFAYLLMLTTARTASIVLLAMAVLFAAFKFCRCKRSLLGRMGSALLAFLAPFIICIFGVVGPIMLESRFYPYYVPLAQEALVGQRLDEFYNRFSRYIRVADSVGIIRSDVLASIIDSISLKNDDQKVNPNQNSRIDQSFSLSISEKTKGRMVRLVKRNEREQRAELLFSTFRLIFKRPLFGYWPEKFHTTIEVNCESEVKCAYPHNLILDLAFNFGVLIATIFVAIIALYIFQTFNRLVSGGNLPLFFSTISLLVYGVGTQLTGTFTELTTPILLMFLAQTEVFLGANKY